MHRFIKNAGFALLLAMFASTSAFALTILKGDEAQKYLGDAKQHFLAAPYTYDILSRSHRDAMHGRFSDGVIFNTDGGLFRFPRRKDGDYEIVIDDPNGREEQPVNEEAWRNKIQNALSDDNRNPWVFLDENKKELAVVYTGNYTQVTAKTNDRGLLQVTIVTEGSRDQGRFKRVLA